MSLTDELTEAYRRSTLSLRATFLASLLPLWKATDVRDIDRSFPFFAASAAALIQQHRTKSVQLAHNYMTLHSVAAGRKPGDLGFGRLAVPQELDAARLLTSIEVTSKVALKRGMSQGRPLKAAADNAFVQLAGSTSRLVLDAGRESIRQTVLDDLASPIPVVQGWRRVTSSSSCDFCTMLANRGAVYKESTADFRSHDHCNCSAEIVYRSD